MACFPHQPLFDTPAHGNPSEFLDETVILQKLERCGRCTMHNANCNRF